MANPLKTIVRAQKGPANDAGIPDSFHPERYKASKNRQAGWWCKQILSRQFLKSLATGGKLKELAIHLEKLMADPFCDLGVTYTNSSKGQIGAPSVSAVSYMTFDRASLLATQQERINASPSSAFDDAIGLFAMDDAAASDLLGFSHTAHIQLDLRATNKQLVADFELWLRRHRRKPYCPTPTKSEFSPKGALNRWHQYCVLTLADIELWALLEGVAIGPTELAEWLTQTSPLPLSGTNAKDYYFKKLRPAYELAFSATTYQTLYSLSKTG